MIFMSSRCLPALCWAASFMLVNTLQEPLSDLDTRQLNNISVIGSEPLIDKTVLALGKLWDFDGCSSLQKNAIRNALSEAHTILSAAGVADLTHHVLIFNIVKWDDYAAVEFFGPPVMVFRVREKIKDVFLKAHNYKDHWWNLHDAQVFCGRKPATPADDGNVCEKAPGTAQYIVVQRKGGKGNSLALIFCDRWFGLGTLDGITNHVPTSKKWSLSHYENRARSWITAMVQMPSINTWNSKLMKFTGILFPTRDQNVFIHQYIIRAEQVKYLSKLHPKEDAMQIVLNPDTWSWYALASFVQDKIGDYPHRPLVPKDLPTMRARSDAQLEGLGPVDAKNISPTSEDPDMAKLKKEMAW
ncbi:hypothetical protein B0O99DRAFT_701024 [Bisporella sp. PMI_857]|nr:hypothetical protein B0O99DRAFT_701024 [Bisporella sp. PMI_857]